MILLSLFSLSAADYYIGAEGGAAFNTVVAGKGYRNYKYKVAAGFKASVPVVIMFSENYGLDTGISVYGKNYKYSQNVAVSATESQTNFDLRYKNTYVEIPVAFRASLPLSPFDLYFSVGGYIGYWVYGERKGTTVNGNGKSEDVREVLDLSLCNRIDAGALLKFGAGVDIDRFRFYADMELAFSVTSMNKRQKYGAYRTHNSTLSLTLGTAVRIN